MRPASSLLVVTAGTLSYFIAAPASHSQANAGGESTFDMPRPVVRHSSDVQVEALRTALSHVVFPAPEGTVKKLLPPQWKPVPVKIVDFRPDLENKGRAGGIVVEYWLNDERILQVATAYYTVDGKHFSREEWAVILTCSERASFSRKVYPY
jgi:hypothetical protein